MPSYARVPTLAAMFLKVLESSFLKGKVPCKAPHSMALAPGTHDKSFSSSQNCGTRAGFSASQLGTGRSDAWAFSAHVGDAYTILVFGPGA